MNRKLTGLGTWLAQRVGAAYMLLFVLVFLFYLLIYPIHSYPEWREWVARPAMSVALFVFFVALLSHMWVGLRDVVFDYVQPAGLRPLLAGVLGIALAGVGAWLVWILFRAQT